MSMARILAVGMIALSTTGQIGWGQESAPENERVRMLLENVNRLAEANKAMVTRLQIAGIDVQEALATPTPSIDLDFPGGSFAALVKQLKAGNPRANLMLDEGAATMKIPPFEAFGVTPAGAILVAKNIMEGGRNIQIETINPRDGSAPTTLVRLAPHVADDYKPSPRRIPIDAPTKAWNLKGWTMDNKAAIQNTLAAIQVGMESYDTPVVLQYHEPSGVLLARGNAQQIAFIESIIEAAAQGVVHSNSREDTVMILREVEREKEEATDAIMILKAKVRVAAEAVSEARSNLAAKTTIAQAEVDLLESEAELKAKERDLEQIEQVIARLKAQLEEFDAEKGDR